MRVLVAAFVAVLLSLVVAGAAGLNVSGGFGATGSGDVLSPALGEIQVEFFPFSGNTTRLDHARVCMDRGSAGSDPGDTTPDTETDHYDVYVQLKDASGDGLGNPKVVHDFANGIDGDEKCDDVSFFEDNVEIADIESIALTICGRHESGDRDFACALPP